MPPAKKTTPPAKTTQPAKADAKADDKVADANADVDAQAAANREAVEAAERQREAEQQVAQQATEDASMGRAEARREADTTEERRVASRVCVVSDGSPHTGYALPGKKICSAHEMHYYPDGTPRVKVHAAAQREVLKPGGGTLSPQP